MPMTLVIDLYIISTIFILNALLFPSDRYSSVPNILHLNVEFFLNVSTLPGLLLFCVKMPQSLSQLNAYFNKHWLAASPQLKLHIKTNVYVI